MRPLFLPLPIMSAIVELASVLIIDMNSPFFARSMAKPSGLKFEVHILGDEPKQISSSFLFSLSFRGSARA